MSWNYRYEVKQIGDEFAVIRKDWTEVAQYFAGYDFMGSVNWETDSTKAEMNSEDIAWDIVNDLLNADADDKPEEPETMKRIDVLRAMAAAHSAFRAELEKHGISMSGWTENEPYTLFIDNGPTKPITILGEYDYKQKINKNLK